MPRLLLAIPLVFVLSVSCSTPEIPDLNRQVDQAVAATLAAIPLPTQFPSPFPIPTPTPFDLNGIFCEYGFCIGHTAGVAYYDHLASQNPQSPSRYDNGFLVAYQVPTMVLHLIWLQAPGTADPGFLMNSLLNDRMDTRSGDLDVILLRGMNVMFTNITTTVSPDLASGGAAAWTCGDRVFAWKAYTQTDETARSLFEQALARFVC